MVVRAKDITHIMIPSVRCETPTITRREMNMVAGVADCCRKYNLGGHGRRCPQPQPAYIITEESGGPELMSMPIVWLGYYAPGPT